MPPTMTKSSRRWTFATAQACRAETPQWRGIYHSPYRRSNHSAGVGYGSRHGHCRPTTRRSRGHRHRSKDCRGEIRSSEVALLVDGVTKIGKARAGREDITTYLPRTKDNLTKLLVAIGADVRVIIIKLADRLHNLRTLEYQPREKQLKKARESLEIFGPLADRLNMGRVRVEIEDLSFKYLAPKRYEKLKNEIETRIGRSKQNLRRRQEGN